MAVAAAIGASIAALLVHISDDPVESSNPFSLVFSPWTRDEPGFVGLVPVTLADWFGSVAFGALVGGTLGLAYWYLRSRSARPN